MTDETTRVRTLGRYHVLDELGRGAMAVVYRGFDPVIGRTVALKTIAFETSEGEVGQLRQHLYREACAAGTLAHPNIVTIYDVIEEGGTTAVAMEFIEGRTLAKLIAERAPLPLDAALDIFEQIAAALDFADSKSLVHRDIKPANIMITPEGRVKVADFGVARIAVSTMTQTGTVVGSPSYMSPEQVRGQALDARSDLFSAAVVLYELLTRERPFTGDDIATTMYRIVHEPATPPSHFNAAIGPALVTVFERALAKDPNDRYRSGAELCRELRQALNTAALPQTPLAPPVAAKSGRAKLYALLAAPVILLLLLVAIGSKPRSSRSNESTQGSGPPAMEPAVPTGQTPATDIAAVSRAEPDVRPAAAAGSGPTGAVSTVPSVAQVPAQPMAPPKGAKRTRADVAGALPIAPPLRAPAPAARASAVSASAAPAPAVAAPVESASDARPNAPTMSIPRVMPPSSSVPATASPARPGSASVQLAFDGGAFPVTLYADGKQVGRVEGADGRLSLKPGRVSLRAVSDGVYLDHEFGTLTLNAGENRVLAVPGTASTYIGVRGDSYGGLRITLDGRAIPGPYPAQLPRVAASPHRISFKWSEGVLQGIEVVGPIDLTGGRQFSIRAVPENGQVVVQKLR